MHICPVNAQRRSNAVTRLRQQGHLGSCRAYTRCAFWSTLRLQHATAHTLRSQLKNPAFTVFSNTKIVEISGEHRVYPSPTGADLSARGPRQRSARELVGKKSRDVAAGAFDTSKLSFAFADFASLSLTTLSAITSSAW